MEHWCKEIKGKLAGRAVGRRIESKESEDVRVLYFPPTRGRTFTRNRDSKATVAWQLSFRLESIESNVRSKAISWQEVR